MKIALTGSSSTGKTTLANCLRTHPEFRRRLPDFVTTDARRILDSLGHANIDNMDPQSLRQFQQLYLARKLELETGKDNYLTDRSFVDVAAYWIERDARDLPPSEYDGLVETCRSAADRYDLHVFLPFGVIPFKSDGYRSHDMEAHGRIGDRISKLLDTWGVRVLRLDMVALDERAAAVLTALPPEAIAS
jgi:predicted ATPase